MNLNQPLQLELDKYCNSTCNCSVEIQQTLGSFRSLTMQINKRLFFQKIFDEKNLAFTCRYTPTSIFMSEVSLDLFWKRTITKYFWEKKHSEEAEKTQKTTDFCYCTSKGWTGSQSRAPKSARNWIFKHSIKNSEIQQLSNIPGPGHHADQK